MLATLIQFLADIVTATISFSGYGGVFLLMAAESCGIPFPSEIIMPFAGFLVAEGRLTFAGVVVAGTVGNLIGSLLAYAVGYFGGRPLIERYGRYILIKKHDLDLADRWFAKYGQWTVFVGRLLPIVRTYISFPAGIGKMDLKKFSLYTTLGALPWCWLFTYLGVKLSDNWSLIKSKLHSLDLIVAGIIVLAIVYYIIKRLRHR